MWHKIGYVCAAVLISLCRIGSEIFYVGGSLQDLYTSFTQLFKVCVKLTGYSLIIFEIFQLLESFVLKHKSSSPSAFRINSVKTSLILSVGWLPHLIVKYPGALCDDTWGMIRQYKMGTVSEHHSVLYTVVLGRIIELFEAIGHPNWGLFAFICIQYAFYVAVFTYLIYLLQKMKLPKWYVYLTLIFCLSSPYIIGYIGVALKDCLYTVAVLLYLCLICELLTDDKVFDRWNIRYFLLVISVVNIWCIRKNGRYLCLFMLAGLGIYVIMKARKRSGAIFFVAMFVSCVLAIGIAQLLTALYHPSKASIAEALSLPFQQTARYVKEYGEEISQEERDIIDKVLAYDTLADNYDTRISDPVKATYKRTSVTTEDLVNYFKVWWKQFLRHPICYFDATWNQNYYLFMPETNNVSFRFSTVDGIGAGGSSVTFEETDFGLRCKDAAVTIYKLIHRLPGVGSMSNVAVHMYLLIIMTTMMFIHKEKCIILLIPDWITVLFVIMGPVIQGYPRYFFPVIYSMPLLIGFTMYRAKKWED